MGFDGIYPLVMTVTREPSTNISRGIPREIVGGEWYDIRTNPWVCLINRRWAPQVMANCSCHHMENNIIYTNIYPLHIHSSCFLVLSSYIYIGSSYTVSPACGHLFHSWGSKSSWTSDSLKNGRNSPCFVPDHWVSLNILSWVKLTRDKPFMES